MFPLPSSTIRGVPLKDEGVVVVVEVEVESPPAGESVLPPLLVKTHVLGSKKQSLFSKHLSPSLSLHFPEVLHEVQQVLEPIQSSSTSQASPFVSAALSNMEDLLHWPANTPRRGTTTSNRVKRGSFSMVSIKCSCAVPPAVPGPLCRRVLNAKLLRNAHKL